MGTKNEKSIRKIREIINMGKKQNDFDMNLEEIQNLNTDYGSLIENVCYPFLEQYQPKITRRPDKFDICDTMLEEQKENERLSETFIRLDKSGFIDKYRKRYNLPRLM